LKDLPEQIDLPADRARSCGVEPPRRALPISIDADLHRGLLALSRLEGSSLFMVLQAGLTAR